MSAPYHNVEEKLEDAMAAVLLSQTGGTLHGNLISGGSLDGFSIFKGFSLEDMEFPAVVVAALQSRPHETRIAVATGNQDVTLSVRVIGHKGDATTTRAAHAQAVAAVRDVLYYDDQDNPGSGLKTLLNSAGVADLTVIRTFPGACTRGVVGGMIQTEAILEVWAMPS